MFRIVFLKNWFVCQSPSFYFIFIMIIIFIFFFFVIIICQISLRVNISVPRSQNVAPLNLFNVYSTLFFYRSVSNLLSCVFKILPKVFFLLLVIVVI